MDDMRQDMGGGATVIGAMMAIAGLKHPVNLVGKKKFILAFSIRI
jgi:leucyl aminopeptidase